MSRSDASYTATMAKLFADQGYWRKAAEIYRALIAQHPGREDLHEALRVLEKRRAERRAPTRQDLALLLREWTDMIRAQNREHIGGRKS